MQSIDADGVYFNGAGPAFNWNVFIYTDSGVFLARRFTARSTSQSR